MVDAFPLQWPTGKPRKKFRSQSKFKSRSIDAVTQIILKEIKLLKGKSVVISTNLRLRNDGLPYSNQAAPADTGAAVYFNYNDKQMCFACDRWDKIHDNLYAIAMTIEALRGIERWGSGDMVQQAFEGFLALPAPAPARSCWAILGIKEGSGEDIIKTAYREKVKTMHPDMGGSLRDFNELVDAMNEAMGRYKTNG